MTSVTDPAGTITYELAADGQPVSITAPGNAVTTFAYDQTRRRTSLTDPSFGTTTYTYDSRGNLATETDADGNTCSYTYDSLDRIVEKETPDLTVAYTYNSLGQLTSAVGDNSTARRFTYDTYGRISTEKYEAPDSKWLQKAYTYSNGNLSSTSYSSHSGMLATENYTYSNGHLLETTTNGNSKATVPPTNGCLPTISLDALIMIWVKFLLPLRVSRMLPVVLILSARIVTTDN